MRCDGADDDEDTAPLWLWLLLINARRQQAGNALVVSCVLGLMTTAAGCDGPGRKPLVLALADLMVHIPGDAMSRPPPPHRTGLGFMTRERGPFMA